MIGAIKRWLKYRRLARESWAPKEVEVDGLGVVHISPMPIPLRIALVEALDNKEEHPLSDFDIYCWLIQECVEEFTGSTSVGMDVAPMVIKRLGEAVIDIAGMTKDAQEETVKKSESIQS